MVVGRGRARLGVARTGAWGEDVTVTKMILLVMAVAMLVIVIRSLRGTSRR